MLFSLLLRLALSLHHAAAYTVEPPSTAAPDTLEDCTLWQVAADSDTCASIEEYWFITDSQFTNYNPSLVSSCDLIVGNSYCVEKNWGIPDPTPTPTPVPIPSGYLEICRAQAGGYKGYCERCVVLCAAETKYVEDCFQSQFATIQRYDSECWQHGGRDCANIAVDKVCPRA